MKEFKIIRSEPKLSYTEQRKIKAKKLAQLIKDQKQGAKINYKDELARKRCFSLKEKTLADNEFLYPADEWKDLK